MTPVQKSRRAVKTRGEIRRAGLMMRPGRPLAERERAHGFESEDFDLLLSHFEIAGRLAVLHPIDQHTQHIDVGWRAGADMIDPGSGVETRKLGGLFLAERALHVYEVTDAGVEALGVISHVFEDLICLQNRVRQPQWNA